MFACFGAQARLAVEAELLHDAVARGEEARIVAQRALIISIQKLRQEDQAEAADACCSCSRAAVSSLSFASAHDRCSKRSADSSL